MFWDKNRQDKRDRKNKYEEDKSKDDTTLLKANNWPTD